MRRLPKFVGALFARGIHTVYETEEGDRIMTWHNRDDARVYKRVLAKAYEPKRVHIFKAKYDGVFLVSRVEVT